MQNVNTKIKHLKEIVLNVLSQCAAAALQYTGIVAKYIGARFARVGKSEERLSVLETLATLLRSGMDVVLALETVSASLPSPLMRKLIGEVKSDVEDGMPLWQALGKTGLLPDRSLALIRVGEQTGRLSENLSMISLQQQKERLFRAKVRSAMMYPVLVLSLTGVIGVCIAWFILPRLASVFSHLNVALPLPTRILIVLGNFLGAHGFSTVLFLGAAGILSCYVLFIWDRTKSAGEWLLFLFPAIRKLLQEIELARFGYLLGTLLKAGLPITNAFDSLTEVTLFRAYRKLYAAMHERIAEGNSFQKSFALYPNVERLIPVAVQQMITAAERSGQLAEALLRVGSTFEEKIEVTTKNLATLVEPILLVVVWLGVVGVAVAVILPIYSLIGGLK